MRKTIRRHFTMKIYTLPRCECQASFSTLLTNNKIIKYESEMKTKTICTQIHVVHCAHTRFPKWKADDNGTFAFEFHLLAHDECEA